MGFYSNFMFNYVFDFMMVVVPLIVIGGFIYVIGNGLSTWHKNNASPLLNVEAKVVAKRTNVSRHHHDNHSSTSTSYYVTFEVKSGDRIELYVSGSEYGMLVEGDMGELSFQGTRYKGFKRSL